MCDMSDDATLPAQRALLERLTALGAEQEQALNAGDVSALTRLSELRAATVRDAAAYLPPAQAWDPTLTTMVADAQERSRNVQQQLSACMAVVRRELVALNDRRHVEDYLAYNATGGSTWQA